VEIKELLGVYGALKAFHLVKDKESGQSKGFCFFEYHDANQTDESVKGLNGLEIRGKTLTVRRAQARQQAGGGAATSALPFLGLPGGIPIPGFPPNMLAGLAAAAAVPATRVLCLNQMVTASELTNDQDYKEISEDIHSECSKYGQVKSVVIPRPSAQGAPVPGVGKVFVEFASPDQAGKARAELEGRQFASRVVAATFYDEGRFAKRDLA